MNIPKLSQTAKRRLLRVVVLVLALVLFSAAERLFGSRGLPHRIDDLMHDLFAPVNSELQSNPRLADALLIAISALADMAGVGLALLSIFAPRIRPLVGLLVLYGMRQAVESLCELPVPEGMIWRYPGFPSLLVDYAVMGDFFFSGHTAVIAYVTAELAAMRRWWLASLGAFCTLFVVMVLFALRAHYTMDVFTGLIAALLAIWMASDIAAYLDRRRAVVPRASTVNLSESG